jgi:DNA-directed RNA polymerase subunit RPC12/RpoP
MVDPFRCVECGAPAASATVCEHCGGRSFELARPLISRHGTEPPLADLVSLQDARAERARRGPVDDRD